MFLFLSKIYKEVRQCSVSPPSKHLLYDPLQYPATDTHMQSPRHTHPVYGMSFAHSYLNTRCERSVDRCTHTTASPFARAVTSFV